MAERLIIIGASALGREVCTYARECGMVVKGFLDSRASLLDGYEGYPPILGTAETWTPSEGEMYVCACGEPEIKRRYAAMLPGVDWATIIHPAAYVGAHVEIGPGSIIRPFATIGNDTVIGSHVVLGPHSHTAHDCRIGDYVSVSPGCTIAGWCDIGACSFLGVNSAVVPHVTLGSREGVFVAAGAVVVSSFESGRLMGVPAKAR